MNKHACGVQTQYLGMFQTAEEAASAHDTALIDNNILNHRGFNFPKEAAMYLANKRSAHDPPAESSRFGEASDTIIAMQAALWFFNGTADKPNT